MPSRRASLGDGVMLRQSGEERASLLTQPARSYYYNDIHFGMTLLLLPRCGGGIHKQAVRVDPPARNKSELLSGGYLCFFILSLSLCGGSRDSLSSPSALFARKSSLLMVRGDAVEGAPEKRSLCTQWAATERATTRSACGHQILRLK